MKTRLALALISLTVAGSTLATDFRLVVNAPPNSLSGATNVRIHGLKFSEGDRIVDVKYGKGPAMFKVSVGDLPSGSMILAKPGTAKGFAGRVVRTARGASSASFDASLENVAAPAGQVVKREPATMTGFFSFLFSGAGIAVVGGLAVLIAIGLMFRKKSNADTVYVPANKRRNVDEALREIIEKLEEIEANQKDLVKKPPVLRSFSKQIATFESRLGQIEGQIKGVGANQLKQTESATALEKTLREVKGRIDSVETGLRTVTGSTDGVRQSLKDLFAKVEVAEEQSRENAARAAEMIVALQKQDGELQSMLFVLQEGQQLANLTTKGLQEELGGLRNKTAGVETVTVALRDSVSEVGEQVAELGAKVEESATRRIEIPDARPAIAELQTAVRALAEKPSADYASDFKNIADALAELRQKTGALERAIGEATDEQLQGQVQEIAQTLSQANEQQAKATAALNERIADLSKRIDQRESILASLQSQVQESGQSSQAGAEMLPVVADMRMALETLSGDHAKSVSALQELSGAVADLRTQSDSKTRDLIAAMSSLAKDRQAQPAAPQTDPAMLDALTALRAESDAKLEKLMGAVSKLEADIHREPASIPAAVEKEPAVQLEIVENKKPVIEEPAAQEPAVPEVASAEPVEVEPIAAEKVEAVEKVKMVKMVDPEPPQAPVVAEATDEDAIETSAGWLGTGGSPERRWSNPAEYAFNIESSEEMMKPLTPTETATIDYPIGAMLVAGERVVYAHGDTLRGFWPEKNPVSATFKKMVLPGDAWRLVATDKRVFCVGETFVEVIDLGSWATYAKFEGTYIDHLATAKGWAGLLQTGEGYAVDFRTKDGKQIGTPIALPTAAGTPKTMAAMDDMVFVGTAEAGIVKVELTGATHFDSGSLDNAELLSLSIYKKSLLALVRVENQDHAFLIDLKGNVQKTVTVGLANELQHPVIMGDCMYIVDAEDKLVTINLKKMELTDSLEIPGDRVMTLCGVYDRKQQALLMTVTDKDTLAGKIILLDTSDGHYAPVCPVNHAHVDAVCTGGHIVVATGSSYQNMFRVFALPAAVGRAKAA